MAVSLFTTFEKEFNSTGLEKRSAEAKRLVHSEGQRN
jgi:hypothetical protein